MDQYWYIDINWNPYFFLFPYFVLNAFFFFFWSKIPFDNWITTLHIVLCCLIVLLAMTTSQDFHCFNGLYSFEEFWWVVLWNFWCFPHAQVGVMAIWEEDTEIECHFITLWKGCTPSTWRQYWCQPWSPGWRNACQISPVWNYSPSSILYSGRISLCVVYKVNKNYSLCPWRLFEILLFWRFVYSIIYLYNHRVMDIYFILLFIIQTYLFILLFTCFSFGHWELFHLFLYPFNICHLCVCLSTYFSFKHFLLLQGAPCSSSILSPHSA